MKKRYIVIYGNIFAQKDWNRFGCQFFLDRGYDVIPIEFIPEKLERAFDNTVLDDYTTIDQAIRITNNQALNEFISSLTRNDLVVVMVNLKPQTQFLFEKLTEYNIDYCVTTMGQLPRSVLLRPNLFYLLKHSRIISEDFRNTLWKIKNFFLNTIKWKTLKAPKWNIVVGKSRHILSKRIPKIWKSSVISIHSPEVELAEKEIDSSRLVSGAYMVFLDQDLWNLPAFSLGDNKQIVTEKEYLPHINKFFSAIEQNTGLKVVIAAHSKSSISEKPYGERVAFKGETANLIRHADLVISSYNSLLNFAVIFQKPLIILTSNELNHHTVTRPIISSLETWLGLSALNINNSNDVRKSSIPEVNKPYYDRYYRHFLAAPNSSGKNWETLAEKFETTI